jgi:glycosyltransferase involved in cell wall biosynthesis
MKILYTLTAYPPSTGGAQIHMHQLAQRLKNNNEVNVICQWNRNRTDWLLGTTLNAESQNHQYEIDEIPVWQIGITENEKKMLARWVYAYPFLQGISIEKISHTLFSIMQQLPVTFDIVHNCRIGREGISFASYQLARKNSAPFVLTPVHHPAWAGWFHRYYHKLYRNADALIALTEIEKKTLAGLGVDERKIHVTGIGPILSSNFSPNRFVNQYELADAPIILFLGQKYAYKGIATLLGATEKVWKVFPETRFVFLGPRTPYSVKLFKNSFDQRILEIDAVPLQEKTDALAACTLLCVPSAQESFGGVYTEAWSLGKPVIGCDIPAVREVVNHGVDGLLVAQDGNAIADAIIQILKSPNECARMGQKGKMKVESRFTWEKIAKKTFEVYESLLL